MNNFLVLNIWDSPTTWLLRQRLSYPTASPTQKWIVLGT